MLWSLRSQQLLCVCGTMRPLRHHWSSSGLIVVYLQSRQQTLQHVQKSLGVPRMDIWTRLFADRRLLSLEDHLALEEPIVDVIRRDSIDLSVPARVYADFYAPHRTALVLAPAFIDRDCAIIFFPANPYETTKTGSRPANNSTMPAL